MNNEIILYKAEDGRLSFDVKIDKETVWLTQKQLAILFDRDYKTISKHINNIFRENELDKKAVVANFAITADDGKIYQVDHYNLDVVISIGYHVKSKRGTQFRIWATQILREHLLNGYSVNKHKIEAISKKLDFVINEVKEIKTEDIKKIHEEQVFLKKMLNPNFVVNNYIDTKPLIEANKQNMADFKEKFNELNKVLNEIQDELALKSEIKIFIKDIQEKADKAQTDPEAKNKLLKTITDLGDSDSGISKMLTAAGVAQNIMQKAYEIGLFLVRNWPF